MAIYNVTDSIWAGGAKGNGTINADQTITLATDDTAAVQAAITAAANAGGGTIYFPPGVYCFLQSSSPLNLDSTLTPEVYNDLTFQGSGTSGTILVFEEGTVSAIGSGFHPLFIGTADRGLATDGVTRLYKGALSFYDMTIRGRMFEVLAGDSSAGTINAGAPAFYLGNFASVNISRCRLFGMCNLCSQFEAIGRANVIGNEFELICRDMCRFRSTFSGIVSGNTFRHSDDDAVSFHQYSVFSSPGEIREGLIISNNQFEDVLGVHILGARKALVSSNVFRRCKVAAVAVDFDSSEGVNPIFGVSIVDNQIFDMIERPSLVSGIYTLNSYTQIGVYVSGAVPRAGTTPVSSQGALPGEPSSSGIFASEFPYYDADYEKSTDAFPGTSQVNISRNTICRTLPARTPSTIPSGLYSSWGLGKCFAGGSNSGVIGWIDPTVPDSSMNPYALIGAPCNVRNAMIADNILSDTHDAIRFETVDNVASALSLQVLISRNVVRRFLSSAVLLQPLTSGANVTVEIADNLFNGDPWHIAPNRNPNGSWTSAEGSGPIGVRGTVSGIWVRRNTFQNVMEPLESTLRMVSAQDNILEGFWQSVGYSTQNLGIGNIPPGSPEWIHRWIYANPTAANYGQLRNAFLFSSQSIPTAGYHVQGAFVRNSNPWNGTGQYVLGWLRATTGNSNLLGTDWFSIALGTS